MFWERDINRSVWTMPNIVAVGSNGKVANGCRALEAIRVIYSMSLLFENVRGARKRVQEGIVLSDELEKRPSTQTTPPPHHVTLTTTFHTTPILPPHRRH